METVFILAGKFFPVNEYGNDFQISRAKKCPVLFFTKTELHFVSYSALNNGMDARKMMSVRLAASPSATAAA